MGISPITGTEEAESTANEETEPTARRSPQYHEHQGEESGLFRSLLTGIYTSYAGFTPSADDIQFVISTLKLKPDQIDGAQAEILGTILGGLLAGSIVRQPNDQLVIVGSPITKTATIAKVPIAAGTIGTLLGGIIAGALTPLTRPPKASDSSSSSGSSSSSSSSRPYAGCPPVEYTGAYPGAYPGFYPGAYPFFYPGAYPGAYPAVNQPSYPGSYPVNYPGFSQEFPVPSSLSGSSSSGSPPSGSPPSESPPTVSSATVSSATVSSSSGSSQGTQGSSPTYPASYPGKKPVYQGVGYSGNRPVYQGVGHSGNRPSYQLVGYHGNRPVYQLVGYPGAHPAGYAGFSQGSYPGGQGVNPGLQNGISASGSVSSAFIALSPATGIVSSADGSSPELSTEAPSEAAPVMDAINVAVPAYRSLLNAKN